MYLWYLMSNEYRFSKLRLRPSVLHEYSHISDRYYFYIIIVILLLSRNCYNNQPLSKHGSYLVISVSLPLPRTTNLLKALIDCMIEYCVDS